MIARRGSGWLRAALAATTAALALLLPAASPAVATRAALSRLTSTPPASLAH